MEYVVKSIGERYLCVRTVPTYVLLQYATVFKSRARAQMFADKHHGKVELYTGRPEPMGTKFFTTPKQSPINRRSAYRSI